MDIGFGNENAVAYHEAGHCIMYFAMSKKFEWVKIKRDGIAYGMVSDKWELDDPLDHMKELRKNVMMLWGGLAVEHVLFQKHPTELINDSKTGASHDMQEIYKLATLVYKGDLLNEFIWGTFNNTLNIVTIKWAQVDLVAKALLRKDNKTLTYEEVKRLLG